MPEKRSFKVESVTTARGCPTKFNHDSRYLSSTPAGAAKKAHTYLCNRKNIRGKCTLVITVEETTRDSKNKQFTYHVQRTKLDEPVVLSNGATFNYKTTAHSSNKLPKGKNCKQSRGIMRKLSKRSKRHSEKHSKKHSKKHSEKHSKKHSRK